MERCWIGSIAQVAFESPDAVAVVFEDESLTYAQFDVRVNRVARYLISRGVGPETTVGLAVRRSLDLLVGMYAIVRAGGAYVPIDPDQPAERNGFIVESASPVLVVSTSRDGFELPESDSESGSGSGRCRWCRSTRWILPVCRRVRCRMGSGLRRCGRTIRRM